MENKKLRSPAAVWPGADPEIGFKEPPPLSISGCQRMGSGGARGGGAPVEIEFCKI